MAEADGAGNWLQTNVRAGGMFLAELQPSGITYLHTDHLGTIRAESNSSGTRTMTCSNLPFGDALNCNGNTDPSGYHFTGKERDSESGNDYFGARYYGSSMGRFLSPDPSQLYYADQTNPQSFNLYSYGWNNPLINTDPSGMECVWDDGSYDAADDPDTGSADKCGAAGGTWEDPSWFESMEGTQYGDWSGKASSQIQFDMLTPSSVTNFPNDSNITLDIPMVVWEWAAQQTTPVSVLPWHYGNWAGPNGMGVPIDNADAGAMMHDYCYAHAPGGSLAAGSNFGPSNAALQACNQQLCDTESKVAADITAKYNVHAFWSNGPGEDNPGASGGWQHETEQELPAANRMVDYFKIAPFHGNGCH